jgi:hypothetical protein
LKWNDWSRCRNHWSRSSGIPNEAYRDFAPWCQENFNFAFSKKKVGMLLTERGLQKSTKDGKRVYVGVAMVSQLTVSQRIKYGKHDENQAPDCHPAAW